MMHIKGGDREMKRFAMPHCEIEVDEEKTKQWYANADEWRCDCGHCINFLEVAKQGKLPGKVLNCLSAFGIPPEKATYLCCLNGDTQKPFYQFSYRIAGNILNDTSPAVAEDTRCCHETYPYGAPNFPEPHFDLEFYFELPWLLNKTAE